MSYNQLDKNLILYAEKTPDYNKLQHLESGVLRAIRMRGYENNWRESVISVFNFQQFQALALSLVFLVGIIFGPFFADQLFNKNTYSDSGEVVSLNVFTAKAPYLITNLIDTIK